MYKIIQRIQYCSKISLFLDFKTVILFLSRIIYFFDVFEFLNKIRVFGPLCDARHGGDGDGGGLLLLLRPPQVRSNHQDDDLYGGQGKTYFLFQRVEVLGSMLVTPRDNEFQKLPYIVILKVKSSILELYNRRAKFYSP